MMSRRVAEQSGAHSRVQEDVGLSAAAETSADIPPGMSNRCQICQTSDYKYKCPGKYHPRRGRTEYCLYRVAFVHASLFI